MCPPRIASAFAASIVAVLATAPAPARAERTMAWLSIESDARLDRAGDLHVRERHEGGSLPPVRIRILLLELTREDVDRGPRLCAGHTGLQTAEHPKTVVVPPLGQLLVLTRGQHTYRRVRVELDPNGSFNTTEFGTVKDAAQFKALYAYSPYHHLRHDEKYPATLLMTGANDGRVNPMHSRKFAAALQATASESPVYLRISTKSGHGIGSSLDERIDQSADWMAFLFDQMGMKID